MKPLLVVIVVVLAALILSGWLRLRALEPFDFEREEPL